MSPKWSKGYSRLGLAKFKAGDLAGAIKAYTSGLAQDPDNTQIADGLAEVCICRTHRPSLRREAAAGFGLGDGPSPSERGAFTLPPPHLVHDDFITTTKI